MRFGFSYSLIFFFISSANAEVSAENLAQNCQICHNRFADQAQIASLYQLTATQIRQMLLDFKYDKTNATLMPRLAKAITDTEIDALAEYIANQTNEND